VIAMFGHLNSSLTSIVLLPEPLDPGVTGLALEFQQR
jgi:hypothetical protein